MKMTIQSMADELGVSKASVSFVLNGRAKEIGISDTSAKRILEHCAKRNFAININARRANSKLTRNVGLVVYGSYSNLPNPLAEPCAAIIAGGIASAAKESGFCVSLIVTNGEDELDTLLRRFQAKEVDGFILSGFPLFDSWRSRFLRDGIPVVMIGENPADGLPTVNIDNYEMSKALSSHIIEKHGRSKLGFLSGGPRSHVGNERKRGFLDAVAEHGLSALFVEDCSFREDFAHQRVKELLRGDFACDALACANDSMAIGAARALLEAGVDIPGDLRLAGADGSRDLNYFPAPIDSYSLLPHEQGAAAFELFHSILENKTGERHMLLHSKLILREA